MLHHDSDKLQALISAFKSAEEQVHTALLETEAKDVKEYKLKLEKKIDSTNIRLIKKSTSWAKKDMPIAYKQGAKQVDGFLLGLSVLGNDTNKEKRKSSKGARVDETDIQNAYIQLAQNVQHATDAQKEAIRNAIDRAENENSFGATVGVVKEIIQEELAKNNAAMVITYNNGVKMPLAAHAEMLARTSRIITSNTGSFDRCKQLGLDLVECTTVPNCCPYCKKYEGKIYSISGNDKRFPALYETALQSGYNIMHPNCRHEFIPYHESYASSPEELKKVIDKSNHFEDLDKNDKLFKLYNADQAFKRQLIKESRDFHEAKALYGDDMPYQTLGGFRRASRDYNEARKKKDGSEKLLPFHATHERNNDKNQYNRWMEIIGEENMPKTLAEFQDLKYNNIEEFKLLGHYKLSRDDGSLPAIASFKFYKEMKVSAEKELIGLQTVSGRFVKSISKHFVDRHIGTIYKQERSDGQEIKHEGVSLDSIKKAILEGTEGKVSPDRLGRKGMIIKLDGVCRITMNPETGELIQCNLMT